MRDQKRFFRFGWLIALWICVLSVRPSPGNEIVFIVNKGVSADKLEKEALRDIFLGNTSVWPDGKKVVFATSSDPSTHKLFVQPYTRKTESQFQAWWKRKLFTGTGKVPPRVKTDQEMIDFVAATEGGMGYVSSSAALGDSVKILTVTDK